MDMPRTITASDAQHQFPQLLAEVANGAEVIIARGKQSGAVARKPAAGQPVTPSARAKMAKAIENLKTARKRVKFSATFEEVMTARDEGRR